MTQAERLAQLRREWGCDQMDRELDEHMARASAYHAPVTTLEELDALDEAEMVSGHLSAEKGDPEPGANHSRAYHHGWRTRMMDLHEIPVPSGHERLVRQWCARERAKRSASNVPAKPARGKGDGG